MASSTALSTSSIMLEVEPRITTVAIRLSSFSEGSKYNDAAPPILSHPTPKIFFPLKCFILSLQRITSSEYDHIGVPNLLYLHYVTETPFIGRRRNLHECQDHCDCMYGDKVSYESLPFMLSKLRIAHHKQQQKQNKQTTKHFG